IFLAPEATQADVDVKPEWSKFGQCTQVVIESVSAVARRVVPTIYDINQCTGYQAKPPPNGVRRNILWYVKTALQFLKKVVLEQPKCLLTLLDKLSATLKPYVSQISSIGCLDEDDYLF
ncbi:hypothetical protein KR054_004359, partial [Drosophila jambulina]